MVFALLRIRQHNRLAEQNLSAIENVSLEWLTLLVYGFAAIWAVDSMQTLSALLKFRLFNHYSQIVSVLLSIYIFGIGLIALARPQIHFHRLVVKPTAKYHRSTLTGSAADQLAEKIKSTVQTQQLYLDNDLSLGALSEHLQMKPHHVSQVLNEKLNMTFYDFINFSRVSRAQEMLSSGQFTQLAIIDIAYQVGFNNKATFNAAFKKYTKQTPSQFKKAALV
ncbi:MAG: helix-turn-helix transcriptional regulator [Algicola sp.]|nr:helix-turn-helix transcriptional regulator [Algicola sp.]